MPFACQAETVSRLRSLSQQVLHTLPFSGFSVITSTPFSFRLILNLYNFSQCQASPDPPPPLSLTPSFPQIPPFPSFIRSSWPLRTWSLSDILLITLNFYTCWLVNTTNGRTQISITCKWQCINEAYSDLQNGNQQSYKHEMEKKKKKQRENKNPLQNANMCNCDGSLGSTKSIFHKKKKKTAITTTKKCTQTYHIALSLHTHKAADST